MGADGMGRNGTAANVQLGPDHHFAGGGAEAVDGVQQDLHSPIPDVLAGDIYGSERRIRQSGKWKSVKADNGNVFGDPQTEVFQGPHRPDGYAVIIGNNGGGKRDAGLQKFPGGAVGAFHCGEHRKDQPRVKG